MPTVFLTLAVIAVIAVPFVVAFRPRRVRHVPTALAVHIANATAAGRR